MKYLYLWITLVAAILLSILVWPRNYISKEEFILDFSNKVEDVSVLSIGFQHKFSFLKPTEVDAVCFEIGNVSFIQREGIFTFGVPLLSVMGQLCTSSDDISIFLENRGDAVVAQKG